MIQISPADAIETPKAEERDRILRADEIQRFYEASFGVTSPLRVDRAPVRFTGPSGFDVGTLPPTDVTRRFDLSPDAREVNAEFGWNRRFGPTWLAVGTGYVLNAGDQCNYSDVAVWTRISAGF